MTTYRAPHLEWGRVRPTAPRGGRPAVEVPADLSALTAAARALLTTRLAWRCGVAQVLVGPGVESVVTFVGLDLDAWTAERRAIADDALTGVGKDAAAGWTPADEHERWAPVLWD